MNTLGRFESLGANAEFAVVQRRGGVRADGVLAWAREVRIADLVRLLDADFLGFCDPDQLAMVASDVLLERRYNIRLPLDAPLAEASDAAMLDLFLRTQARAWAQSAGTVARLRAADTIFVYASPSLPDAADMRALHAALQRFGDNALLLVHAGVEPGVQLVERQLYLGAISTFASGDAVLEGIRVAEWEALCRATLRLHAPAPRNRAPRTCNRLQCNLRRRPPAPPNALPPPCGCTGTASSPPPRPATRPFSTPSRATPTRCICSGWWPTRRARPSARWR